MANSPKTVLIAGATGYLGRNLITAYHTAGYRVLALARRPEALIHLSTQIDEIVFAEATRPETLTGIMESVDLVVSAVGITRQRDNLTYDQVDYKANVNLLNEAVKAGVERFVYIHVLNAQSMPKIDLAVAKARFAALLNAADIDSTIIAPSGFFSDLEEVFDMARKGRVYLFGDGSALISPIDGRDLAEICVGVSQSGEARIEVGGPQTFSLNAVAEMAFSALGEPPRILHIPALPIRIGLNLAKGLGFGQRIGALDFFFAASQIDMSAPAHGSRTLADFYSSLANRKQHAA